MNDLSAVYDPLNRIADTLEDISKKLDHIITKQTEDFLRYRK